MKNNLYVFKIHKKNELLTFVIFIENITTLGK